MRITIFQAKKINGILDAAKITYNQLQDTDMIKRSHEASCLEKTLTLTEYNRIIAKSMPYFQGKIDGIQEVVDELKI